MNVTVYTKPNCQPCKATKRTFVRNGVAYEERQAGDHLDYLASLEHTAAPVVVVRDQAGDIVDHWSGFRMDKCKALA